LYGARAMAVFIKPGGVLGFFYIIGATLGLAGSLIGLIYFTAEQQKAKSASNWILAVALLFIGLLIALVALSYGGNPGGGAQLGTACIGQPGFSCSNPTINQSGVLSVSLGEGLGYSVHDFELACVSSSNALGNPDELGYQPVAANENWSSGETVSVNNLQCYPGTGSTSGMLRPIGSVFTGVIWMKSSTPGMQFLKVATVSVKSSS